VHLTPSACTVPSRDVSPPAGEVNDNEHTAAGSSLAAIVEREPNSEYTQQQARPTPVAEARRPDCANPRRSPAASQRKVRGAAIREI
jgi:hypothetical protein